ncbi:response regulator [Rhizorhabdus argentea]|uniref:response regulator n=1 Tax=Rhizorhabdus argentea TaxID=1387174 RepID=UPI0030EF2B64
MDKNLVLVVEDEPMICSMMEDALVEGGFEVACCGTADEALRFLDRGGHGPVGLVTDIRVASDVSGWDVARHARERYPQVGVVYVSADSGSDWSAFGVPGSVFIQKPFASAQIVTGVSTVLNQASGLTAE